MAATGPDRRGADSLPDLFRRPLPARLRLSAGRGAPVEEEREATRFRAASEPRSPPGRMGLFPIASFRLRAWFFSVYQAQAWRVVGMSA